MATDFLKFDDAEPLSPEEEKEARLRAKMKIENEAWKMKGMRVSRTEFGIARLKNLRVM